MVKIGQSDTPGRPSQRGAFGVSIEETSEPGWRGSANKWESIVQHRPQACRPSGMDCRIIATFDDLQTQFRKHERSMQSPRYFFRRRKISWVY